MKLTDLVVVQEQGTIEIGNYEDIKNGLADMMQVYKEMDYTEDSLQVAKKDVATLRKIMNAFESRRKEVKKTYLKPYETFEKQVKELVVLINEPIDLINDQIVVYESKRREEKQSLIRALYEENIGEAAEYLTLEKIYNNRWENVSYTAKQITKDIEDIAANTMMAVNTIKGMNSDVVQKALNLYKEDLSITNAISYINKYEAQKAEIIKREQERKEAAERDEIEREKAELERREREIARQKIEAEEQRKRNEAFANPEVYTEQEAHPFDTSFTESVVANREWRNITIKATDLEYEQILKYIRSMGIEV